MRESLVVERHVRNRDEKFIRPIFNAARDVSFSSVSSESSRPLAKGDHVHALPYWSEVMQMTKTDLTGILWSYMGDVYPGDFGRATFGDATDWPWPRYRGGEMNKATWTFNVTSFVTHPPLALPNGSDAEWNTLVRLADTKALGNLRKALVNLPLIIAERRETLAMLGKKVAQIARAANALQTKSMDELKRTSPKNRRAVIRRISNEHLEFVFGWVPVLSEIEGIADFIQKDQLDFIRSRGVQVLRSSSQYASATPMVPYWAQNSYFSGGSPFGTMDSKGTKTTSIGVRTALRYRLSSTLVGDLYALGFDPVGAVFDMVPLSFISGWISNFDYWIRTLTPTFGLEFETGSRNRRRFQAFDVKGRFYPVKTGRYHCIGKVDEGHVYGNIRRDEREVLHAPPESTLDWDVEVGLYEVAAGASLLIQRYLKPLRKSFKVRVFRYKGPRPKWLKEIRYTGRT